ncbi:hypothetical protein JCM10450v2_001878 [Rhodotorula kratochvilovae]
MPPRTRTTALGPVIKVTTRPAHSSGRTAPHSTRPTSAAAPAKSTRSSPTRKKPTARHESPVSAADAADAAGEDDDASSDGSSAVRGQLLPSAAAERTTRAETEIVPETDNEGFGAASPPASGSAARADQGAEEGGAALQRSAKAGKTYGKAKGKGKGKAVDPAPVEDAQDGDAVDETDYDEEIFVSPHRAATGDVTDGAVAQKTAPPDSPARHTRAAEAMAAAEEEAEAGPSQPAAARSPAKGEAPAEGKSPAKDKSPVKRRSPQKKRAAPKKKKKEARLEPRSEGEEEATPPASDGGDYDGEEDVDELLSDDEKPDEERPPQVFMHWEDGGWVADRIWVHDRWVRPGKREQVVKYIKNNGGKVMREILHADIAILPDWTDEQYKELYSKATASLSRPTVYSWLQDCSRQTASHGAPFRPSPDNYVAPVPKARSSAFESDRRGKRYLRLKEEELERFAQWYNRWKAGQVGLEEVFERMQREFYDVNQSHRTTISAFRAAFEEHEVQIKTLARRLRDARTSRSPSAPASPFPASTSAGTRKRRVSPSASPSTAPSPPRAKKQKRRLASPTPEPDPDPALLSAFSSLPSLATRFHRPPALVPALCLACSLDLARTERALERLAEYEMSITGLSREEEARDEPAGRRWGELCAEVWSVEEDGVLRAAGEGVSNGELVGRLEGKTVRDVRERKELLSALGDESGGWTLTREEVRRMRDEDVGEDDDDEEELSEGADGS